MVSDLTFRSLNHLGDFPHGPVVKNPPANAGDMGSIPGQGNKIPHVVGQLSLHVTTTEPACSRACVPQLEKPEFHNEETVHSNERSCMPH